MTICSSSQSPVGRPVAAAVTVPAAGSRDPAASSSAPPSLPCVLGYARRVLPFTCMYQIQVELQPIKPSICKPTVSS